MSTLAQPLQKAADAFAAFEADVAFKFPDLTAHDRCDRDQGEAAAGQVKTPAGILRFCGHHYRQHAPALKARGYAVQPPADYAEPFTHATPVAEMYKNQVRDAGSAAS